MRHGIIQSSIAQNFKANGIYDYCYQPKRKRKCSKINKYKKNLKLLMKSRSKSSNKAEKEKFEAKNVVEFNLQLTSIGL